MYNFKLQFSTFVEWKLLSTEKEKAEVVIMYRSDGGKALSMQL